jgi:hypothetical protein
MRHAVVVARTIRHEAPSTLARVVSFGCDAQLPNTYVKRQTLWDIVTSEVPPSRSTDVLGVVWGGAGGARGPSAAWAAAAGTSMTV